MIVVCGEVVLDLVREPDGASFDSPIRYLARPGGSPANTAVALARLGSHAALCARISRSNVGLLIRDHLVANSIDLTYAIEASEPATLAFVEIDVDGVATYSFYVEGTADWGWTSSELPSSLPDFATVLHAGSMAALAAPGRAAISQLLARERANRLVSLDLNVRPVVVTTAGDARRWIEGLVTSVHLVKASLEDIALLYPGDAIDSVVSRWRSLGASVVIVTLGSAGSVGYLGDEMIMRPAVTVDVVDTVGAGDAFAGALLHWLDEEKLTLQVSAGTLSCEALGSALEFASLAAAISCTRVGADPPFSTEVADPPHGVVVRDP